MLKNYFLSAFRNFRQHRLFTFINVVGLSIGLAACLIIALFVFNELSFDRHYINADRIYRVQRTGLTSEGNDYSVPYTSVLLGPLMLEEMPAITQVARLGEKVGLLSRDNYSAREEQLTFADNSLFEVFDFQWLAGEPAFALQDQSSVVLTKSLAIKYFGDKQPLGEALLLDNQFPLIVTGVIEDLPGNTHINASAFVALSLLEAVYRSEGFSIHSWRLDSVMTYFQLKPSATIDSIQFALPAFVERHIPQESSSIGLALIKLSDIHMLSPLGFENSLPAGSLVQVVGYSAIGLSILLIAIINFMNLSTAHNTKRSMEVGLRKTIGASRTQLVKQFLGEALIISGVALAVAVVLVEFSLPFINPLIGTSLSFSMVNIVHLLTGLIAFTVFLGLCAGSYPAFYLSSFKPSSVLNKEIASAAGAAFREALVVVQFSVAIALIIAAAVIVTQMRFLDEMDRGFNPRQLLVLSLPAQSDFDQGLNLGAMKTELLGHPGIESVSHGLSSPLDRRGLHGEFNKLGREETVEMTIFISEPAYLEMMDAELLAGRYLSTDIDSDRIKPFDPDRPDSISGSVILSELAAKLMGWAPEQAIGQEIRFNAFGSMGIARVVGVVKNTVGTAKLESVPEVYWSQRDWHTFSNTLVFIRLADNNVQQSLDHIDSVWRRFIPDSPVNRWFLDDQLDLLYINERNQMQLLLIFAGLAVAIACFGLFGLATYNTERRTKEIGVRKVMGANVWSIVLLLTNDFSKLVLIANLLAWPIAYFTMNRWLENFAYRIDLTPLIFIGSGLIALCIAWVTVGGTAAKAASRKPVLALRCE